MESSAGDLTCLMQNRVWCGWHNRQFWEGNTKQEVENKFIKENLNRVDYIPLARFLSPGEKSLNASFSGAVPLHSSPRTAEVNAQNASTRPPR